MFHSTSVSDTTLNITMNRHPFMPIKAIPNSLLIFIAILISGCGGGDDGPAIDTKLPQSITFDTAPELNQGGTATVSATASSGLAVSYSSDSPTVCSVDPNTGVVTNIIAGACLIIAYQPGDTNYAAAQSVSQTIEVAPNREQTITFAAAPTLSLGGTATVSAAASSGLAVSYTSTTPDVCSVSTDTGLVTDLTAGDCIIAADQAGDNFFEAAAQVQQTITVDISPGVSVPEAPSEVTAVAHDGLDRVTVNVGETDSGGSTILAYTVTSQPEGILMTGTSLPIAVTCPTTCAGHTFTVVATNALGDSPPSAPANVVASYDVEATFYEPDTQPQNSIFTGTFTFDATTNTVSDLRGTLTESMTGPPMITLQLTHQLSSVSDSSLGGLLVTTFLNNNTDTFTTDPGVGGSDGWEPGSGFGLYSGFPGANPGNAYAMIFVNLSDPTTPLTQAQLDKIAYADCAPGGMMGATCMTGTTVAGYGSVGTMSGYPISQIITQR
jgi:hypothetical protein